MKTNSPTLSRLCLAMLLCLASISAGACSRMSLGNLGAKTAATGAAGGETAIGANPGLARCASPLGTLAVNEDHGADWYSYLHGYGIQSTVPILRLLAQQSNCFAVVERGRGMKGMMRERALAGSGELRRGSNFGKRQMAAADYTVTPTLIFQAHNTGHLGGVVSAFLPGSIARFTRFAGGVETKDAQSMLALVDNRSGVQVAVAEGSGRSFDMGGVLNLLGLFGGRSGGGLDAYQRTPQGKVVVASLTDAFNNLVTATQNYRPQKSPGPKGLGTGGKLKVN